MHQASVQCVVLSRGGSNSNLQNVQVQVQRSVVQTSIDVVITAAAVAVINVRARVQVSGPTTTMVTTALLPGAWCPGVRCHYTRFIAALLLMAADPLPPALQLLQLQTIH